MKHILFLTGDLSVPVPNGGTIGNKNNMNILRSLPDVEVTVFSLVRTVPAQDYNNIHFLQSSKNIFEICLFCLAGFYGYLTPKSQNYILKYLSENHADILFLDSSSYGQLAKKAKKLFPRLNIVSYFHNVEYIYTRSRVKLEGILYLTQWLAAYRNERDAMRYSDIKIAINSRDKTELERIYKMPVDAVYSSIWFYDVPATEENSKPLSKPLEVLFFGSYFYANIAGIGWFIEKVLPGADIHLTVAGRGMEELRKRYRQSEKLRITGTVEDPAALYAAADCVVVPVFDGSGMKVKTGEALRYGKTVAGTKEAFTGYAITNGAEGYVCETADDFIRAFKRISAEQETKYNPASAAYCEKYLSKEAAASFYQSIINKL